MTAVLVAAARTARARFSLLRASCRSAWSFRSPLFLAVLNGQVWASDIFTGTAFVTGTMDPSTGMFTFVSNQGGSSNWWVLAANRVAGVLYTVDASNGDLKAMTPSGVITTIGGTGISLVSGLAYDNGTGVLYAIGSTGGSTPPNLYTSNTTTGISTFIGATGMPFTGNAYDLAYDEATGVFLVNDGTSHLLYQVNRATGAATLIGSSGVTTRIDGLA